MRAVTSICGISDSHCRKFDSARRSRHAICSAASRRKAQRLFTNRSPEPRRTQILPASRRREPTAEITFMRGGRAIHTGPFLRSTQIKSFAPERNRSASHAAFHNLRGGMDHFLHRLRAAAPPALPPRRDLPFTKSGRAVRARTQTPRHSYRQKLSRPPLARLQ